MRTDPSFRQLALFPDNRVRWEHVPAEIRAQVLELIARALEHSLATKSSKPLKEKPHV